MFDFQVIDGFSYTVIADLIYTSGSTNITNTIYTKTILSSALPSQSRICNDQDDDHSYQMIKALSIKQIMPLTNFSIKISYQSQNPVNIIRINNFFIYGFFCAPFCQTCSFSAPNICTSCIFTNSNSQCGCPIISSMYEYRPFFYQEGYGCVSECLRNQYIAQLDEICHKELRFVEHYNFMSLLGNQNQYRTIPISNLDTQTFTNYCSNNSNDYIVGIFQTTVVKLQLPNLQNFGIIRIRITLYFILINFSDLPKLNITLDGINYFQVSIDSFGTFNFVGERVDLSFLNVVNCITHNYDIIYRFELVTIPKTLNPILAFDGVMVSTKWGFSNITIDAINCKQNCNICEDAHTCSQCIQGYFLYLSECVQSCPIHSTNCIDYEYEIPISYYLVKATYDSNMTLDEISSYYDSVDNLLTNFLTGVKFSFYNNKFVLGGLLVWNNAIYQKIYSLTDPHYAISLRFNITFGDDFSGLFQYYIDSILQETIFRNPSIYDQNLVGKSSKETIQFVYNYFEHQISTLQLDFKCSTAQDLRDGFCAISEYFIVVHKCIPTCSSCQNLDVCTNGIQQQCEAPNFWQYVESVLTYTCQTCIISNCQQCISNLQCRSCTFNQNNKFALKEGKCICQGKYYRELRNGMCQCQNGYIDDPMNFFCLPICGDLLIVEGEQCDDGNIIPFDGCNQCQFQCELECQNCINGECLQCNPNYQLIHQQCLINCDQHNNQFPCSIDTFTVQFIQANNVLFFEQLLQRG